jgi:hypothetical protein
VGLFCLEAFLRLQDMMMWWSRSRYFEFWDMWDHVSSDILLIEASVVQVSVAWHG